MEGFLMKYSIRDNNRGFTLIEVMVAVIILAVGLLGLAKFQGELVRSAAATKDRTAALALAEKKIEDLRAFSQKALPVDGSGSDILWSTANNQTNSVIMAYDYIADNQGGRLDPGDQVEYVTGSGEQLTLSWAMQAVPIIGAQEVVVTVSWTDQKNQLQTVQLTEIISATNQGVSSPITGETGTNFDDPQITYTPGIAPEVVNIDVDTGDGLKKETSKPLPDVFHNGDYNKVTFDVVTYRDGTNEVVRKESFTNVNCLCTAASGTSLTPAYTVFENGSVTIRDVEGTLVTKNTGQPANNLQPVECNTCCRDHTNPSTLPTDALGATISYGTVNYTASGDYPEACRMKYINGKLRVYQDWNLKTVTVMPESYVSDGEATQTIYQDYVVNYVKDNTTTKDTLTGRDVTVNQGGNTQLLARPIYIDNVYNATNASPTYASFLSIKIADGDANTLQFIPFFEINLTKIANWTASNCTDTNPNTGACVRSQDIVDEGLTENNYSRGLVTADGSSTILATSIITARLNEGNSGVVGDIDNGGVSSTAADNVTATVGDAIATFDVTGNISLCALSNPGANTRKAALFAAVEGANVVRYSGTSSGSCTVAGNGNNRTLTCSSIPATGANITIAISTEPAAITSVTYTNGNNTNIVGPLTNVDAVICDY
jgi:prepilin-type N-terminal cleavage/methylation domain-containing protein